MLINVKQVKNIVKAAGMQTSLEFIEELNRSVSTKLDGVIKTAQAQKAKRISSDMLDTV